MTLRRFIRDTILPNLTEGRKVEVTPAGPNRRARRDHGYRGGHQTQAPPASEARRRRKLAARAHDLNTGRRRIDIETATVQAMDQVYDQVVKGNGGIPGVDR